MPDSMSAEKRSKIMKSIRAQSKLENRVSKALWHQGIRFRKNVRSLRGTPDIAIKKYKVVIFIDSCFWHACSEHGNRPKSNQDFWNKKLNRNLERDQEVNDYYNSNGWHYKRVWEHDLKKHHFDRTIEDIVDFINKAKDSTP